MSQLVTKSVKVVLLGESGVGKTSIINCFTKDTFDTETKSTMGATFMVKDMDFPEKGIKLRFQIWDTAGQEKYRSMVKLFYKDAKAIILVFSINVKETYEQLVNFWINEIKQNAQKDVILCVAENKYDLYEEEQVKEEEAKLFSQSINAFFKQTSAKTKSGVAEMFDYIGHKYVENLENVKTSEEPNQNNNTKKEKKKIENKKAEEGDGQAGIKLNEANSNNDKKDKKKCCGGNKNKDSKENENNTK